MGIHLNERSGGTMDSVKDATFVIGAGAHVDYGFPTGEGVKEIIRQMHFGNKNDNYNSDANEVRLKLIKIFSSDISDELVVHYLQDLNKIKRYKLDQKVDELLKCFSVDFLESSSPTIDSFLSMKPKWSSLGKLVIATIIRHYEAKDPLKRRKSSWIQMIVSSYLQAGIDKETLIRNFPSIITFNYDRLIEEIIYKRALSLWSSHLEARKFVDNLNIIHVYGKVGEISFSSIQNESNEELYRASKEIKTIAEERTENEELRNIRFSIFRCYNLYFLGFGFDEQNMELLFEINRDNAYDSFLVNYYSTNIGLQQHLKESALSMLEKSIEGFSDSEILDCSMLLTKYLVSEKTKNFQNNDRKRYKDYFISVKKNIMKYWDLSGVAPSINLNDVYDRITSEVIKHLQHCDREGLIRYINDVEKSFAGREVNNYYERGLVADYLYQAGNQVLSLNFKPTEWDLGKALLKSD